jgi:hypothetical protein
VSSEYHPSLKGEANLDRHKLIPPPTFRIVGLEAHVGVELSSLQFLIAH